MPVLTEDVLQMKLPKMVKVRQNFSGTHIDYVEKAIRLELEQDKIRMLIKPGQSIAVAVGSRGINNIAGIVKETVQFLKKCGTKPFIIPAMGSHGGGTAQGQAEVLSNFGITEQTMGVPVISSMDVVLLGHVLDDIPVYIDKHALSADMIVLVNRIKPHTAFRGKIESGLCKMMAIGLGKHEGCSRLHKEGWPDFSNIVVSVASLIMKKANIGFGLAVVENAFEQTAMIKAVIKDEIIEVESELLATAKALMPALQIPDFDVLVIEQIGKDISGAGMDPNITGRSVSIGKVVGYSGPKIKRMVVLDLSEATHGNASGVGNADFITRKVFEKIDFTSTYANVIAAGSPEVGRIPIIMDTDREAILAAIACCGKTDAAGVKIVRIKDTLNIGEIWISENMLHLDNANNLIEISE